MESNISNPFQNLKLILFSKLMSSHIIKKTGGNSKSRGIFSCDSEVSFKRDLLVMQKSRLIEWPLHWGIIVKPEINPL